MRVLLLAVFVANLLFSYSSELKNMTLLQLFNNKQYSYICERRWHYINAYSEKREDLLSLVAYACLKKNNITPALDVAKVLRFTKEGRKNATYIVTLFLMKKFIIQMIEDNLDIGNINLPKINDNTLGVLFLELEKGNYERKNGSLVVNLGNKMYKLWLKKADLVIETYIDGTLKTREYYW